MKRDIRSTGEALRTHASVLRALELCVDMWRQPLRAVDSNTRAPITLMGEVVCEAPPSPDGWMLRTGNSAKLGNFF